MSMISRTKFLAGAEGGRAGPLATPLGVRSQRVIRGGAGGPALPGHHSVTRLVLALGFVALLTGCGILPKPQADPAHFYTLGGKVSDAPPPAGGTLRIGLRPVELPAYLQNRAMVVRSGSEIRYEQNHRWAEPLDEAIARVVRARLLAAPSVAAVYPSPFPIDQPRDYDVTVRVVRCEGARGADGKATTQFVAVVEITRADASHEVVSRQNFPATGTAWEGKDFSALAAALGDSVGTLSQDIATTLPAAK